MFHGNDASVARLKELLKNFDTPEKKQDQPSYYIYRLQHTSGEVIEDDLDSIAKNMKTSGVKDNDVLDVLENIRYVKETNSLLLTGDPKAIDDVKGIIAENDYPRNAPLVNSSFFMYKPKSATASQIEKSLKDVAAHLKKADLADAPLLSTIHSMKYVETTNSLVFTGGPDALGKVQTLLKDIDIPPQKHAPIQHVGKTTFLLYKLKVASGSQVLSSLKAMTSELKKSGASDKDFIAALQSAKYVKETNSLLFTGNEEALVKVQAFVEKFDVTGLAAPVEEMPSAGGTDFLLYKPVSVPGAELEKMMLDFSENLKMSGLSDADLFSAVHSMRWVEKTQSLIFTGTPKALSQIHNLLTGFDISSNLPEHPPTGPLEPSIQAIDNTSFLVYKLQFHKGDEIQGALRQIAKDLTLSNAPVNKNLLNSINSIQWLAVTNSLLCSGDQETLVRLRELIKNLDIPLKQVYIEMLVIETNLSNALQFGLEWGSKYKYRNKFQGSMSNTLPQTSSQTSCTTDTTMTTLNGLIPANPPPTITQNIPFGCGFDLGIIGQVIKHNGATFLTLGSLLTAVQQDDETSVVITPKIITQDGRTSTIFFGQNVPFVGSFVNNQGTNVVQTSNLEYRDIGLNLTITPVLGNSDIVTLDISLDRTQTATDVTGAAINFNNQSAQGITTSRTTMQTTVHVPDKNFLILSGFVNNSNVKSKAGIPCLGGLPFIGAAFSKDNNTVSNNNIVIFLRPHIISSVDDLRRVTADQEDAFRDQQGTPFLIKQFDEGMELIKSINDE
jgi:type II secretory pathway component GspD/PulD (secretin)